MGATLAELMKSKGIALTSEEELEEKESLEVKHRGKTVLKRPNTEVTLLSLAREQFEPKKSQKDPTDDLIELNKKCDEDDDLALISMGGYVVWCKDTQQMWFAPTKMCLDANFIYRDDLEIIIVDDYEKVISWYKGICSELDLGVQTRKTCYILDNVSNETYEVYYDSNYPTLSYGKATPNGMFIHKYKNRFHRDMAILELDDIYSNQSHKKAGKLTAKEFKSNEAIVISDGCWMREVCANAFYYLDATSVIKFTEGILPTEPDQAVLIAEIKGATNALLMCKMKNKKNITYYYDNTSILNVFRNRKTEYIKEIVEYKELLESLYKDGYKINFVELHPKTGEQREVENKALMFFHNGCDKECRDMTDIFKKDYKSHATLGSRDGKSYDDVKKEFAPKGKPGQSKGYKPGNNYNPRKH